jgi:hypothetical protein
LWELLAQMSWLVVKFDRFSICRLSAPFSWHVSRPISYPESRTAIDPPTLPPIVAPTITIASTTSIQNFFTGSLESSLEVAAHVTLRGLAAPDRSSTHLLLAFVEVVAGI